MSSFCGSSFAAKKILEVLIHHQFFSSELHLLHILISEPMTRRCNKIPWTTQPPLELLSGVSRKGREDFGTILMGGEADSGSMCTIETNSSLYSFPSDPPQPGLIYSLLIF